MDKQKLLYTSMDVNIQTGDFIIDFKQRKIHVYWEKVFKSLICLTYFIAFVICMNYSISQLT